MYKVVNTVIVQKCETHKDFIIFESTNKFNDNKDILTGKVWDVSG